MANEKYTIELTAEQLGTLGLLATLGASVFEAESACKCGQCNKHHDEVIDVLADEMQQVLLANQASEILNKTKP